MNQSELEANTCDQRQARENTGEQVAIGFGFAALYDWLSKFAPFSRPMVSQNKTNRDLLANSDWFVWLFTSIVIGENN